MKKAADDAQTVLENPTEDPGGDDDVEGTLRGPGEHARTRAPT